ncbi:MAG: hypothetical protein JO316_02575 [Abitibacteriaceae bacterium]|nr:hypothetical protein [Abditibacteriaceae bacterium]MBV9864213.1 hypothetical protein [Abditibacteriaceae bacterium]
MKQYLVALMVVGLAGAAQANEKVTLSGVHNCCGGCAAGITKAVGSVAGVTSTLDGDKVSLEAANTDGLQKAVAALLTAGYTGVSDNAAVKVAPATGPDEKVTSLTVTGAHMCCGKCVKAAKEAVKSVAGVKSDTIAPHAESFKVEGEFNAKDLMNALAKAGFTGQVTK